MAHGFFIAGTDTGIGKTYIATSLLRLLKQKGFSTIALKPLACGGVATPDGLRNEDAVILSEMATQQLSYSQINPIAFAEPIAPHIAAEHMHVRLTAGGLYEACCNVITSDVDYIIVEGCGGWEVPLNHKETLADFAYLLGYPIILVVGMRLGCLNHFILTIKSIQNKKMNLAGWVANCIDAEMPALSENIQTLTQYFEKPPLDIVSLNGSLSIKQEELFIEPVIALE